MFFEVPCYFFPCSFRLRPCGVFENGEPIYIYIYIYIWDESLLFSNCARSLEYSSSSTLAGLSYHICGKLEVAIIGSPSSQHQHCTDEAQKVETVLSAVRYSSLV